MPIAKDINDYWQPIKTWTTVALTISQNGLALSASTIALLVALIIYRFILYQQEKTSLLTLYNKLPTQKQLLVKAVKSAKKHGNPTIDGIANEITQLSDTQTTPEQLKNDLNEAEKVGLIQRALVNKEDKPAYAWTSTLREHNIFRAFPIINRFLK